MINKVIIILMLMISILYSSQTQMYFVDCDEQVDTKKNDCREVVTERGDFLYIKKYYKSGVLKFEGVADATACKRIYQGKAIWYNEEGSKELVTEYNKQGKIIRQNFYDKFGKLLRSIYKKKH